MEVSKLFDVRGKVVLITGGSRGLGEMMAEAFVLNGARVYISSRKKSQCDRVAETLNQREVAGEAGKGVCVSLPADLSTLQGVAHLVDQFSKREEVLDVLVNNAGFGWREKFETFPEIGWNKVMDLNVRAVFFLTQALTPHLRRGFERTGTRTRVINISSVEGLLPENDNTYSYAASKAAVVHLTRVLARRLAGEGINVSGIAPGAFPSDMNPIARSHADEIRHGIPADRVGDKHDMAGAVLFLASRAGSYILGDTLVLDGGLVHAGPWPLRPAAAARGSL
jgi:NAD(P)-dependent dehydrogenase (short-subunit alcohol dehydrogenase family)